MLARCLRRPAALRSFVPSAPATKLAGLSGRQFVPLVAFGAARRGLASAGDTVDVPIPELGAESISEGSILSIAKSVGDFVDVEEMVAEIETDKVTIEAKSPEAGTIKAIHVEVGQTVEVGAAFFTLAPGVGEVLGEDLDVKLKLWHGVNTAFLLSEGGGG